MGGDVPLDLLFFNLTPEKLELPDFLREVFREPHLMWMCS